VTRHCEALQNGNLELTTVSNDDLLGGLAAGAAVAFNLFDNIQAFNDAAEDNVLTVKPCGLDGAKEELGSIGSWSSVGHGEDTCARH